MIKIYSLSADQNLLMSTNQNLAKKKKKKR